MSDLGSMEPARCFLDGSRRSVVKLDTMVIGLGTYLPGWRWSLHAGPQSGRASSRHVGYVVSGQLTIRDSAGHEVHVGPGQLFEAEQGHDAWVVGEAPCVALDFEPTSDE